MWKKRKTFGSLVSISWKTLNNEGRTKSKDVLVTNCMMLSQTFLVGVEEDHRHFQWQPIAASGATLECWLSQRYSELYFGHRHCCEEYLPISFTSVITQSIFMIFRTGRSTAEVVTPILVLICLLLVSHDGRFEKHQISKKKNLLQNSRVGDTSYRAS
jgi:hypothetical protein